MSNLFVSVYSFRETGHLKRSQGQKRPFTDSLSSQETLLEQNQ